MLSERATYPKQNRLLRRSEYLRLSASIPLVRGRAFILLVKDNALGVPRIGITVSRKVGCAVVRNKIKRQLREVFRKLRGLLPPVDLHVIARRYAADCSVISLRDEFSTALNKIG